ncbi:hypothetical protein Y1Q_0010332 [Alligator mississippiensis]|uniref:DNA topoisomerase I eukaryotic-type domain-containing protein n=1 Tax=Alligator mississippiensis TaxID=8496 RepID=A0A151NM86_ALLMI|nr:hypothetical protein Y1Q_0010332 [Alligator mississippiensis]
MDPALQKNAKAAKFSILACEKWDHSGCVNYRCSDYYLYAFKDRASEGQPPGMLTSMLNKYLQCLMEGLTAKVFRTYNASITLQQQLKALTDSQDSIPAKILSYNRANRAVAVLCNHQRAPPKTFEQSMANLQAKTETKREQLSLAKKELKQAKQDVKGSDSEKLKNE